MKKILILTGLLFLLLFSAMGAAAQDDAGGPNDPTVNDHANACYAGGSLAGRCNVDFNGDGVVEDYETTWVWECGWYLIRVEYSLLPAGAIPSRCASVLPQPFPCYVQTGLPYSFKFVGGANEPGNVEFYNNPICGGFPGMRSNDTSLIVAGSYAEALAICQSLGRVVFLQELSTVGYDTPPGYYGCTAYN